MGSIDNDVSDIPGSFGSAKGLPAGIVYTSGTTGIPKGAVLTNGNLTSSVVQNSYADFGWVKNDRFLGIMPPLIAYGLTCVIVIPLCLGMEVFIIPKFEHEEFANYILKHRPQHVMGVPSYVVRLVNSKELDGETLDFLKTLVVGGDKMGPKEEEAANEFLRSHHASCRVTKGYGLTETSSAAVLRDAMSVIKPGMLAFR